MDPFMICEAWARALPITDPMLKALLEWAGDVERSVFTDYGRGPWHLRDDAPHVFTEGWAWSELVDARTEEERGDLYDAKLPIAETALTLVLAAANATTALRLVKP